MASDTYANPPEVTRQIGIRLSASVASRIEALAKQENNGLASVCRRLLSAGLALEDRRGEK